MSIRTHQSIPIPVPSSGKRSKPTISSLPTVAKWTLRDLVAVKRAVKPPRRPPRNPPIRRVARVSGIFPPHHCVAGEIRDDSAVQSIAESIWILVVGVAEFVGEALPPISDTIETADDLVGPL